MIDCDLLLVSQFRNALKVIICALLAILPECPVPLFD